MEKKILEIYVHIPFCERKCHYCDFLSFPADDDTINLYIKNLLSEIKEKSKFLTDYIVASIYIGGGTPSSIDFIHIGNIISTIYKFFNINEACEITIEANPHSSIYDKLKSYYEFGINRISFGVQSANDNELQMLNRLHSFNDFLLCFDNCIHIGFKNINVDIMKGIPLQTIDSYKNTLKKILKLNPKHLSIYDLIVEENTLFFNLKKENKLILPDEEEMEKIDNLTLELISYYNYKQYEISNYCKNGFICLHNLGYWSDIEYIGFGLNAASYLKNVRYKNISDLKTYLSMDFKILNSTNKNSYFDEINYLTKYELINEYFFLGMRKVNGISETEFFNKFNDTFLNFYSEKIKKYLDKKLIIHQNNRYFFSKRGMQISNQILSDLLL